jgi:hypothetical protein
LGQKFYDNIRIREIFLSKLRGVRINKPSYIYTLNNGIFRSYNAYQPSEFMITCNPRISFNKKERKIPPLSEDLYIASGYEGLDIALGGGFPKKGVVLVEIDSYINTRVVMTFLARIISNFVITCNPILFQLFDGFDPGIVVTYLESHLAAAPRNGLIKIFCPADKVEISSDYIIPYQNCNDFEKRFEFFRNIVLKTRQENPEKLLLNIMDIDVHQNMHKHGQINKMEILPFIRANTDLSLLVIQHPQNLIEHLSGVYDIHLRLIIINGTLFLQSLLPWSHLFAIVTDRSLGYPKIKLESVV